VRSTNTDEYRETADSLAARLLFLSALVAGGFPFAKFPLGHERRDVPVVRDRNNGYLDNGEDRGSFDSRRQMPLGPLRDEGETQFPDI